MSLARRECTSPPSPVFSTTERPQVGSPRTPSIASGTSPGGWVTGRTPSPAPCAPDGLSSSGWSSRMWPICTRQGSRGVQVMSSPPMVTRCYSPVRTTTPSHAEVQVSAMLGVQAEGLLYGVARDEDRVLAGLVDEGIPVILFNRGAPPSPPSAPCYPTIMPGRGWPSNTSSRWGIATSCTWGDRRTCPPPSTASAPSRRYSEKPVWPGVAASLIVTPRRRATG